MTKLQNSIFQVLSLTWCLMFWVVPAAYIYVAGTPTFWMTNPIAVFFFAVFVLAVGYIPMVFFGVGLVVVIESVLRGGKNGVLRISSDSWHAKIVDKQSATLCSYCWFVPAAMIVAFGGYVLKCIVYAVSFLYLCVYVWIMSWSRERNPKVSILSVILKENRRPRELFHPRKITATLVPQKDVQVPKEPNIIMRRLAGCALFIMDIIATAIDVIVILKNKACPRIEKI